MENKQKMSKKMLGMILADVIAAVAIVSIALATYISSKNYDKTWIGNTHGNVANRSIVAEYGDNFYFADDAIYEVNAENECRVIADCKATDLVVYDGYLYYVNYDDAQCIYRTNLETLESELVSAISGGYINIVEGILYYASLYGTSYSGIYKIDLNGEFDPQAPEQITVDWASNLLYYDGRLYFINQADTSRLYSMKLDGSDRAVSAGRATSAFMFYEGNLYYANVYGVYRCKPDGSNLSQLSEIRSSTLNIANGYIYHCFYADSSSTYDQSLYRMELNGSHETILTSDSGSYISYLDGFIYFRNVYKGQEIYRINEENTIFENVLKLYGVN